MHGPHRRDVLRDNRRNTPPALRNVAAEAAGEANVVVDVDEDADVEDVAELRHCEDENALDDDDRPGLDAAGDASDAGVLFEVVRWDVDGRTCGLRKRRGPAGDVGRRSTRTNCNDVLPQEVKVERAGVVKIGRATLVVREVAEVVVVAVLLNVGDIVSKEIKQTLDE